MRAQDSHMPAAADDAAERSQLASMDTLELVELWEKPMPAASRARLLAEIERRRYRTKSLPPPPPDDATATPLPKSEEVDRQRMEGSALILLVLGVLQLVSGAYSIWTLRSSGLFVGLVGAGFPFAIGVAFLLLHRAARSRPHPTLTIGLLLYIGMQALQAVLVLAFGDPALLLAGLPVAVLILLGLGYGAAASRRSRTVERAAAPDPVHRLDR